MTICSTDIPLNTLELLHISKMCIDEYRNTSQRFNYKQKLEHDRRGSVVHCYFHWKHHVELVR